MAHEFPRSQSEVASLIEQQLREDFGDDIDLTESSVFSTLTNVFASVVANNQEQSLQEVYESAFLETATGEDLEAVVALAGITRRSAVSATGVQQFSANGQTTANRVIPRGTTIQTDGTNPVEFETTERSVIRFFDDFEQSDALNSYEGDVADASIVSTNVYNGLQALELAATDGAHIYDPNHSVKRGASWSVHVRPETGTAPTATWAIQTLQDHYQVVVDEASDEVRLEEVSGGSITTLDSTTASVPTAYVRVDIEWTITGRLAATVVNESTDPPTTLGEVATTDNFTYLSGPIGFKSSDANGVKKFDYASMRTTSNNIRAISSGPIGNVGTNAITALPSNIAGVQSTTNQYPTGDTSYINTDGIRFVSGEDAETDTELRGRAKESVSAGGAGTADALLGELVNNVDGVTSVSIYENKTDSDNTSSGGLPPFSFEAVVYGGDELDIAEAIYDTKAVTATDYSGVRGTSVSRTIVSDVNEQQFDIEFSRPFELDIDVTVDLIVDDTYSGDSAVQDAIVQYIGGVDSNGTEILGTGVGEDIGIDTLRDAIVDESLGVVGLDYSVDSDPLSTTPTKTTVDGLEVIEVGANEVAQADATDGSLTINTRGQ
jgi:uncharacterized phage protein gp47/JayE